MNTWKNIYGTVAQYAMGYDEEVTTNPEITTQVWYGGIKYKWMYQFND